MKLLPVFIGVFLLSFSANSQANYEITALGTTYSQTDLQNVFNSANFCGSHYQNQRFLIVFDDGAQVELLSAAEIPQFSSDCILDDNATIPSCVYSIASGVIHRQCEYTDLPKELYYELNSNN
jgi:hypothetical protein